MAGKLTSRSVPGGYVPPVLTVTRKPAKPAVHPVTRLHAHARPTARGNKHAGQRTMKPAVQPTQLPADPFGTYGPDATATAGGGAVIGSGAFSDGGGASAAGGPDESDPYAAAALPATSPASSGAKKSSSKYPWWHYPLYVGGGLLGAGALYGYVKYRQVTWPIRWVKRVYSAASIVGR